MLKLRWVTLLMIAVLVFCVESAGQNRPASVEQQIHTHVTACMLARSAFATLCTKGFSSLFASTAALIATGWSEPVPGRV
jgi:hypothetical protein